MHRAFTVSSTWLVGLVAEFVLAFPLRSSSAFHTCRPHYARQQHARSFAREHDRVRCRRSSERRKATPERSALDRLSCQHFRVPQLHPHLCEISQHSRYALGEFPDFRARPSVPVLWLAPRVPPASPLSWKDCRTDSDHPKRGGSCFLLFDNIFFRQTFASFDPSPQSRPKSS